MIRRELYLKKIRPFIGTDVIKVITGMRRSGKSVLLELIQAELRERNPAVRIFSVHLDDDENKRFLTKGVLYDHVNGLLKEAGDEMVYLFFDEIHDVEEWETAVNSLRMRKNADIYITGSNSKLLSGELATYLTGRYVEIKITPFSFAEFVEAAKPVFPDEDTSQLFNRYLVTGGIPFLPKVRYDDEASRAYLHDLYAAILLKDVVRRKQVRDVDLLDRIVRFVMTECGHTFSARRIVNFLKGERRETSVETVLNYLTACEEAFLIARVPRQDLIGKRILSVDEKFYVTDTGLRNTIVRGNLRRDVDQLLENVVYFEFMRRGYEVTAGRVREKEVDFVCDRGRERIYVQVAFSLGSADTREREYGALEQIRTTDAKMLLTMDRIDMSDGTIRHFNIPDFLLAEAR
ncbi:MAG: ATP-binding protein [Synergistaceae bacterium]|nr:ATP-binding protein [Synergistaceae bacterium]MBQ7188992.1 ATP-binding protein [Kiritimatiellia bacterium]